MLMEVPMQRYTPENDNDVFSLLVVSSSSFKKLYRHGSSHHHSDGHPLDAAGRGSRRLLFCTMLSSGFSKYAAGAAKLAAAIQADIPVLSSKLNLQVDTAVLEVSENPIPPKVWKLLKESGWQRKITRPRIPPRKEGVQSFPNFADQLTKLHLWSLVEYDWILYMDSDVFILRSLLPCVSHVLSVGTGTKIAAARDVGDFAEYFNMGMFMVQPSLAEYHQLLCKLHGTTKDCTSIPFAEGWMEQGLLNAAYYKNWTEMPGICSMNIALWQQPWLDSVWRLNATSIRAVHFTTMKPWDWTCPWTQYAPMCYLFWNERSLRFHAGKKDFNKKM